MAGLRMILRLPTWALCLALSGAACAPAIIVNKVDEREANRIIEVLADNGVQAKKGMVDTGREIYFTLSVTTNDRLAAIRVLNQYEMPARMDKGYHETFANSGLIPTSGEERAKYLAALEGEIEKQLKLIDGVLDVQVQIVLPEESALRTTQEEKPPTTASVTLKFMEGANGGKPLSEPDVKSLVAAGVESLDPESVKVVMSAVSFRGTKGSATSASAGILDLSKQQRIAFGALIVFVLLLGLAYVFAQSRLTRVRSKLIRLQTEIAKARQAPGE